MLFEETELRELDKVGVKNNTAKDQLKKKPAPLIKHWIGINNVGYILVLKKPKEKEVLTILEVESMDIANEVLSAVKNTQSEKLYSKGNFQIPNWKTVGFHIGFSPLNLIQLNVWLSKVITALGYEKRNTYSIINEPSDLIKKINEKRGITPESIAKQQQEINAFVESLNDDLKRKALDEDQAQERELEKMKQRHNQIQTDHAEQLAYQQSRRNSNTITESKIA